MKIYFAIIAWTQLLLLGISIALLAILPGFLTLRGDSIDTDTLFFLAHTSLFFVMIIRPLADLLPTVRFVRPLVILRKGVGVFSAAIIVSFILAKVVVAPGEYISNFFSAAYWSFERLAFFAHSADVAAILLLVTSNNLSKKILGANWKRLQKLSYVYFYASGIYVVVLFSDYLVLLYMIVVTALVVLAYKENRKMRIIKNKI